jgi:hypothetical protein
VAVCLSLPPRYHYQGETAALVAARTHQENTDPVVVEPHQLVQQVVPHWNL